MDFGKLAYFSADNHSRESSPKSFHLNNCQALDEATNPYLSQFPEVDQ